MKNLKRVFMPILTIILIAAAVFIWRVYQADNPSAKGTISGNGTVEATEVELSSKIAGRLVTLDVHESDNVFVGQLIAVLDSGDLEGQVEQARGKLAAAEAVLAELKAGTRAEDIKRLRARFEASKMALKQATARWNLIRAGARKEEIGRLRAVLRQAEVNLSDSETEFKRAQMLEKQGAIPGRDLDQAKTRRDYARAQVEAATQRLAEAQAGARPEELMEAEAAVAQADAGVQAAGAELELALAGPRKETLDVARAKVEQAHGSLQSAEYLLEQTRIRSPIEGRVTLRNSEPGEIITTGFPIVRLADLSRVYLRVYVPEQRVGLLKLGDRAEVMTDSYPGKKYAGTVVEIAEKPEFTPKNVQTREERVKLVFGVKIQLDNPEQELKPGMPADAVIHYADR